MLNLFSEYKRIINSIHVLTYEKEGDIFRSVVHLKFIDKSILFIKNMFLKTMKENMHIIGLIMTGD